MKYSFRPSAFTQERHFTISDGKLVIEEEKKETQNIPLDSISKVKLSFVDPKNLKDFYLCQLFTKDGKKIEIRSTHFKALADFEDRAESYTPFIVALHRELPGSVKFVKGSNWGTFLFTILMLLLATLLFLIFGLYHAIFSTVWLGILLLLGSVVTFLRTIKNFRKNKPGSYDLNNIPTTLLPS